LLKKHPKNEKGCVKKQNTLISGVVILTISNLLVKMAGLLFKIPMNFIVGDTGMGYYNSAYSIYTLFYMLSTSGLPIALSVMVSECRSTGKLYAAKRIYRTAMALFAFGGLFSCALMFFAAEELSNLISSDKSALSVMVAAPTMFFICVSSALRGFFQGCENMIPTAISQLIEAVGKLVIGIFAALYAIRMGYGIHVIAAYAVGGLSLGSLAGMLFLLFAKFWRGDRDLMVNGCDISTEKPTYKQIFVRFLKISLPITFSASVMSLTNTIDTVLIQRLLQASGMSAESAATMYGNYTSLAVPMFNLPPVLVYPIAYSLVPLVASSFASGKREEATKAIENSMKAAVIIALPSAMGMAVLSDPILCLFYKESSAHIASPLLTMLAPSSFFVCILAVTNSVLQGCGKESRPVISMLCGGFVKVISSFVLIKQYGIFGAPLSTLLCYLTVTVVNFMFVVKYTEIRLKMTKTFLKPLAASMLCAVSARLSYSTLVSCVSTKSACVCSIAVAMVIYFAVLILTGVFSTDEIIKKIREYVGIPNRKEKKIEQGN